MAVILRNGVSFVLGGRFLFTRCQGKDESANLQKYRVAQKPYILLLATGLHRTSTEKGALDVSLSI